MPVRQLPANPDLDHLKAQARDLLAGCAAADPGACQRLRELHPGFVQAGDAAIAGARLTWSDGLFAIAREYGFASWPRLKLRVASNEPSGRSFRDRIEDSLFAAAVDAIDDGDLETLGGLLARHPDLARRHAHFEGENYFRAPALLAFVAENPVRNDSMPPNIVEVAQLILDLGGAANRMDVGETLALVASGRVAREAGHQRALIELLVAYGANPSGALNPALGHGEFAAARTLLDLGATMALPAAAAFGEADTVARLLEGSNADERHLAVAFAAQHGQAAVLRLLLAAGENPNRFNPPGAHSHSTPLHQAASHGHAEAVQVLLDHGARTDLRDILWNGTAADWARHAGREAIAQMLSG